MTDKNATPAAMTIEMVNLDAIREYDANPRTISDEAVEAVAKSIDEFGFRVPVILDADNVLIVGHTRTRAARKRGLVSVPALRATDLSREQIRAFRIADNQLGTKTAWDYSLLQTELAALQAVDFDLEALGFTDDALPSLLAPGGTDGQTDPDDVPLPPDDATTKPGDLIILGGHRLYCGDSGSEVDLDRLLGGARIHLVNTDPPYNVKVEPRSNNAVAAGLSSFGDGAPGDPRGAKRNGDTRKSDGLLHHQSFDAHRFGARKATHAKLRAKDRPLANDFVTDEAFEAMLLKWFGNMARVLEPGRSLYIWGGYANVANYPPALKACDLYFSQTIIWVKEHPVLTRKDFMGNHEWCFYCWKHDAGHVWYGPNNATDVWSVKKVNPQSMVHLTEKPVELAKRAIEYSSRAGENVLDLFGGSGSTLMGCEEMGRHAFLMELDPLYCDVIVLRWEKFTGKKAERIAAADVPAPGPRPTPTPTKKTKAKAAKK